MHALTTQRPRFIRLFVRVVAYLAAVNLYELRDGGFSESKGGLGLERARQLQQEPPYLRRSRDLSGCGVEALLRVCMRVRGMCLLGELRRSRRECCLSTAPTAIASLTCVRMSLIPTAMFMSRDLLGLQRHDES